MVEVLAWIALIFGATWIYMFIVSISRDFKDGEDASDRYKTVCFFMLVLFTMFGMLTATGVVFNG